MKIQIESEYNYILTKKENTQKHYSRPGIMRESYFFDCLATFLTLPAPFDFKLFLGLAPKAFFLATPDTFSLLELGLGFDLTALATFPPFAFFFATSLLFLETETFFMDTFLTSSVPLTLDFSFLIAAFSTCKSLSFSSGDNLKHPAPLLPASAPGTTLPSSLIFLSILLSNTGLGTMEAPTMYFPMAGRDNPFLSLVACNAFVIMVLYDGLLVEAIVLV